LKKELTGVFHRALDTAGFIGGPMVEEFERDFAAFCTTSHCIGVGSGTDALRFALIAAGVAPGSIVLTVPNTFIATTEAISQAGARPDFIDIDERTYNMDPRKLAAYLEDECYVDIDTGETIHRDLDRIVKAIVPVHLYGQTADMDPILDLAERYNLVVVEDACQAHGAEYFSQRDNCWKKAGSMGHAAAFSFYPGKNLGACGEAGAVTTNDPELAKKVRMLRDHGQNRKYFHETEGYNGRLDAIQAGILTVKLKHLPKWNERRREAAARYAELFPALIGDPEYVGQVVNLRTECHSVQASAARPVASPVHPGHSTVPSATQSYLPPFEPEWAKAVYHLYVVRVPDREGLMRHLAEAGIGTGIHYPVPLHLQKAYESLGYQAGDFPVTERVAAEIVSLPMFPQLTAEQQVRVVIGLESFLPAAHRVAAQAGASYKRAVA
jgi:dTDP-4-amino-4,6-dideoxygalactose transaminase